MMMRRLKNIAFGLALIAACSNPAAAGGFLSNGMPTAGGSQYPTTLPLTGLETLEVDTNLPNGQSPQSESVTTAQLFGIVGSLGVGGYRNRLVGGDFGVNPWQRGTTFTGIANAVTYTADRWAAYGGASSSISVSKQTGASDIVAGFAASLRFGRANTDTGAIYLTQALTSANSTVLQGQQVELSFWAKAGAQFSSASGLLGTKIICGTGSDQSMANLLAGTWTSQANVVSQNTTIGTTWTRYSAVGTVPATATQCGVQFSYTPVGTNNTTDWVEFAGVQLAANPVGVAYNGLTTALGNMLAFDGRTAEVETVLAERYYWQLAELSGGYVTTGIVSATNVEKAVLAFPVTMRAIPTCTFTSGTFKWNLNGSVSTPTTLTEVTGTSTQLLTIGDSAPGTAGSIAALYGTGTSGLIACSAEL